MGSRINSRSLIVPALGVVLAFMGLFVVATVLLGNGNQLGKLCRYLLVIGFLVGWNFPRQGFLTWLVLCGYTDLLKRLMVVFGKVQYSDLYNVLGIPPVMLAGITLSLLVGAVTGRVKAEKIHWKLLATSGVLMILSAALAAKTGGGSLGAILPAIANDGSYAMLLFVVPMLFRKSDDAVRIAKLLLWAYLPVAAYGVVQRAVGFQPFEIAYLKTGLSMEIKQLFAAEVRAFSTMNSPTALSVVSGFLCTISAMLALTPRPGERRALLNPGIAVCFCLLYLAAVVASTSRSAFLFIGVAFGGFLCFRSKLATGLLYGALGAAFLSLIIFADFLLGHLDFIQDSVSAVTGETEFVYQMTRVGTFSDRLMGFSHLLTNPEVYTLFGYGPGRGQDEHDPLYAHDLISNVLVVYGLVPLLVGFAIGFVVLRKLHGGILGLPDDHHRRLASGLLGLAFSFFAISAVSGNILSVFPLNAFLWLCLGLLGLVLESGYAPAPVEEPAQPPAEPPPPTESRTRARFRRSGVGAPISRM